MGLASLGDAPVLCTGEDSKRSEPASSFALAVPNTTASCISSSTNFEAPAAYLAISMDLPGNHIILDMAQTPFEFGVVPLLPPARRNWSGVAPFSITDGVINFSSLPRPDLCSSVSTISYVFLGQPSRWLLKKRKQTGRSDSTIIKCCVLWRENSAFPGWGFVPINARTCFCTELEDHWLFY